LMYTRTLAAINTHRRLKNAYDTSKLRAPAALRLGLSINKATARNTRTEAAD